MRSFLLAGLLLVGVSALAVDTPTVYTVATSHLDTQWRWTIQTTIDEYLLKTLDENFALLEQYPDYVFNFEGAFRYQLIKQAHFLASFCFEHLGRLYHHQGIGKTHQPWQEPGHAAVR